MLGCRVVVALLGFGSLLVLAVLTIAEAQATGRFGQDMLSRLIDQGDHRALDIEAQDRQLRKRREGFVPGGPGRVAIPAQFIELDAVEAEGDVDGGSLGGFPTLGVALDFTLALQF